MYLLFYVLGIASICLAAGSAFLIDIFFFISTRKRKLLLNEVHTINRLNSIGLAATAIAGLSEVMVAVIQYSSANLAQLPSYFTYSVIIMLMVTFTCSLTLRGVHLPALVRHQHQYAHLSDSFLEHHQSLIGTCAVSSLSWLFIVVIIALQNQNISVNVDFTELFIVYVILAYIVSKIPAWLR